MIPKLNFKTQDSFLTNIFGGEIIFAGGEIACHLFNFQILRISRFKILVSRPVKVISPPTMFAKKLLLLLKFDLEVTFWKR